MKKIILVLGATVMATIGCYAQSSAPANAKVLSFEEANRLNGKAEPTINGKPYSQYKAEQDALKRKTPAATATIPAGIVTLNSSSLPAAANSTVKGIPAATTGLNDGGKAGETTKVEPFVTKADNKGAVTTTTNVALPAALKGSSMDPDARPTVPAANKTAEVNLPAQNSTNTVVVPDTVPAVPVTTSKQAPPVTEKEVKKN